MVCLGAVLPAPCHRRPQEADCRGLRGKGAACADASCKWHMHLKHCGGEFIKVKEPEGYASRAKGAGGSEGGAGPFKGRGLKVGGAEEGLEGKAGEAGPSIAPPLKRRRKGEPVVKGRPITDFFPSAGTTTSSATAAAVPAAPAPAPAAAAVPAAGRQASWAQALPDAAAVAPAGASGPSATAPPPAAEAAPAARAAALSASGPLTAALRRELAAEAAERRMQALLGSRAEVGAGAGAQGPAAQEALRKEGGGISQPASQAVLQGSIEVIELLSSDDEEWESPIDFVGRAKQRPSPDLSGREGWDAGSEGDGGGSIRSSRRGWEGAESPVL